MTELHLPPELGLSAKVLSSDEKSLHECHLLYKGDQFWGRMERPRALTPGQEAWGLYGRQGLLTRGRSPAHCWKNLEGGP